MTQTHVHTHTQPALIPLAYILLQLTNIVFFLSFLLGYSARLLVMWYPCSLKSADIGFCSVLTSLTGSDFPDPKGFLVSRKTRFDTTKQSWFMEKNCVFLVLQCIKVTQSWFFKKKKNITEDLGNSWCDQQHVSKSWGGRVSRHVHTHCHSRRGNGVCQSHVWEWVMDAYSAERDKCRHIPPWPDRHRRPRLIITLLVLRHNSYLMFDDGRGRLPTKWRPVKLTDAIASKLFHNHFTHFPCHHYSHKFLEQPFFFNIQCSVMMCDFSYLFADDLAMMCTSTNKITVWFNSLQVTMHCFFWWLLTH